MLSPIKTPVALLTILLSLLSVSLATTSSTKFTPEAMLSAPRRGTAIPNRDGSLALYTVSEYSFSEHTTSHGLYVMDIKNGTSWLFSNSSAIINAVWLGDGNKIIWLVSEDDGSTKFLVGDATSPGDKSIPAGSVPGPIDGLKLADLGNSTLGVAFYGQASPDGTLYNPELAYTPASTGRMYTKLFVRHWDTYITRERNSIWYAALSKIIGSSGIIQYNLSEPVNALYGFGVESPVPPFGGSDNYDISKYGLAYVAKDKRLGQANTTKSDVYFVALKTFTEGGPPLTRIITTPGLEGASASPVFAPSSPSLAFVRMRHIAYESDKNRILVVPDITKDSTAMEHYPSSDGKGSWDSSPSTLLWSQDEQTLYAAADDKARTRLFSLPASPYESKKPLPIFVNGAVSDFHLLGDNQLLVSSTNFIDNSLYSIVDPVRAWNSYGGDGVTAISSNTDYGAKYGLSQDQISEFYYRAGDYEVQAWIIRPSFFKEDEKYPLAFYIHGGPQGATSESWSTRWNMAVFAEQGYVVVAFNPTGSTGFGQNLTDDIQNQWGGRPYEDLVAGYNYIATNLTYIDIDRAVALGASYGGYMVNWIQGQELGRKFKALVTHDGVFNTLNQYASEELWFMQHDFNGTLWSNFDNYARWNPANHTDNWSTPHLIIHNDRDYRLPVTEGLAAFNVLQERGVESMFLGFPDENHWVLKPENSLVWHKAVLDWLNGHVGLEKYSRKGDEEYRALLMNGDRI